MLMSMVTDPERPRTDNDPIYIKEYLSSAFMKVVYKCKELEKVLFQMMYHLPNNCVSCPNKLSKKITENNVPNFWTVEKSIEKLSKLATYLYVLINHMMISKCYCYIDLIRSFICIMNVLYKVLIAKYMYKSDHDKMLDMVFCTYNVKEMIELLVYIKSFFENIISSRICRTYERPRTKNLAKILNAKNFFIHLKRPCPVQNLTAETTWLIETGSKGQTEVTPRFYKHPVKIKGEGLRGIPKLKKWIFYTKNEQKMKNNTWNFEIYDIKMHRIENPGKNNGKYVEKKEKVVRQLKFKMTTWHFIMIISKPTHLKNG